MDCMFESITRNVKNVGEIKLKKCSVLNKFEVKTRGIEVDKVIGVDLRKYPYPKNLTEVKELKISQQHVLYAPTGIDNFFQILDSLTIITSHLKEIKQNDLKIYPDLKALDLHGNVLEIVEKDLLTSTHSV